MNQWIKHYYKKIIVVLLLLAMALSSVFVIAKYATAPESYRMTIQSIDDKKSAVMGITAAAATTSAVLSAIPGDVTDPIANQIMNISSYLMLVVCVLVLEKSLLTLMGFLAFDFLIPASCVLFGVYTFLRKEALKTLAIKLIIFSIVIVGIIPCSLKIGDMICEINSASVAQVTESVDEIEEAEKEEDQSWLDGVIHKFKDSTAAAGDYAKQKLNDFIDAVAIFIIAYCVIPVITVILVIWFVKYLLGWKRSDERKISLRKRIEIEKESKEMTKVEV